MSIHKFIIRFDTEVSFKLLDYPGTALKLLKTSFDDGWNNLGLDVQPTTKITAIQSDKDDISREVVVEPKFITYMEESANGKTVDNFLQDPFIKQLFEFIDVYFNEFEIRNINRAGIRIFDFQENETRDEVRDFFKKECSSRLQQAIENANGSTFDYGVILEGNIDEDIKFRYATGPFADGDIVRHFQKVKNISENSKDKFSLTLDLDLYQSSFTTSYAKASKWLATNFDKANRFKEAIRKDIFKKPDNIEEKKNGN